MGVSFIFILWFWFWGVPVKHFLEVFSFNWQVLLLYSSEIPNPCCCLSVFPSCQLSNDVLQLLVSSVFWSCLHSFGFLCHPPPFVLSHYFLDYFDFPSIWSWLSLILCYLSSSWFFFISSISFQVLLLIQGLFFPFLKHVLIRIFTVLTVRICSPLSIKFGV